MNERIIEITDMAAHLSIDRGFMVVSIKGDKDYKVPVEDIGGIIGNSYHLSYSNNLLVKLAELNIPLVVCNNSHKPVGLLWSMESHSFTAGRIDFQLEAKGTLYKKLWKTVVKCKIHNQSVVLKALNKNYIKIESLIPKVTSGDSKNIEGNAARVYWQELFGIDFIRDRDASGVNSMLNYGYTIIRSGIARAIMGAGLHPGIGIFHKNKRNPMRLVDDLMEPFRPIVDYKVYNIVKYGENLLTQSIKKELVNLLYLDMRSIKGITPMFKRMQSLAVSYANSLEFLKDLLDVHMIGINELASMDKV